MWNEGKTVALESLVLSQIVSQLHMSKVAIR